MPNIRFETLNFLRGQKQKLESKWSTRDRAASFRVGGAKEECVKENVFGGGRGGHACGFLFNFSKVTENVNNDKTIDLQ